MSQRQIENTIPVLAVRDLDRSLGFYEGILGFGVEWRAENLCSIARDGCSIMLLLSPAPGGGTVWVGLATSDLFSSLGHSPAKILQAPTNNPWAHDMKIADPDGNVIWLGAEPKGR